MTLRIDLSVITEHFRYGCMMERWEDVEGMRLLALFCVFAQGRTDSWTVSCKDLSTSLLLTIRKSIGFKLANISLQFCYPINTNMPLYKLHVIEFDSLNTFAGKINITTKGLWFPTTNNMPCNETGMQLKTFPPKSMTIGSLLAHKISTRICVVMTAELFITV